MKLTSTPVFSVDDVTAAVDEHQRARCAEAAQVDRRDRAVALRRHLELVLFGDVPGRDAEVADHFDQRRIALLLQVLLRDHIDRQGGVFGAAFDVGTGNDDLLDRGLLLGGFLGAMPGFAKRDTGMPRLRRSPIVSR